MSLRQTIIRTALLIVVLIGIGLYLYFYEFKGSKKRQEAQEEAKKVFQVDKDKIVEVRLARADEGDIVFTKKDNAWRIESPIQADADEDAVNRMVSEFADAKRTRTIDEEPKDLAVYGLDRPELKISATIQEKQQPATILFGKENPTQTAVYAKIENEKPIFLIQQYSKRSMDKKLHDLRDKRIADVKKDEVQAVELDRGGVKIALEKKDDGAWMLSSPLKVRGDKSEAEKLVDKINTGRIEEFVNEDPQNLAEYGLDSPSIRLTMLIGKDRASKTVLIGRKNDDKKGYYAKRAEQKPVFLLKEELVQAIPEKVDTLRDHSLFAVDAGDVQKLEYVVDGQKFLLAKDAEGGWNIEEPVKEKGDNLEINDLITGLKNVKTKEFFDKEKDEFGFGKPQVVARLWKKGSDQPITVVIGGKNAEKKIVYARTMDGVAVAVDEAELEKAKPRKTLSDFRDKVLVAFDKANVEKMSVRYGDSELVLTQKNEKWNVEKPERLRIGKQTDVDTLVWAVNYLKIEETVEGQKPSDLSTYGLDKPRAEFTVALTWNKSVGPFLIGNSKDGNVYVMTKDKPGVYCIKGEILDELKNSLGTILGKTLPEAASLLKPAAEKPAAASAAPSQ